MSDPLILVVLLNYRTASMTAKAADAAVVAMQGLNAEMVIVDNDSGDGSFEALCDHVTMRQWDNVRVLQSGHNGGFGAGNNFGIAAGLSDGRSPDYYYLLNSDAFPARDALHQLVSYLEANKDVGIAGSFIHGQDDTPHVTAFRFPGIASEFEGAARTGIITRLLRRKRVPIVPLPGTPMTVDWLAGASMLLRHRMLERTGLFDERFFLYFEETDLCRRAKAAGWRTVYLPASRVAHIGSASTGMKTWSRIPRFWLESRAYYFAKSHGRIYGLLATLAHVAGGAIYRVRQTLEGKPRQDPEHFLRDLIAHDFDRLRRHGGRPAPKVRVLQTRTDS